MESGCKLLALNFIWAGMVVLSLLSGLLTGQMGAVSDAAFSGAQSAVERAVSMAGTLCLWSGIMEVLRQAGLMERLAALFRPLLRRLLPEACRDQETLEALCGNVSANLLGLGNAATPLGIQAARRMARTADGVASDELCLLVVLNTASIQLLPTTIAGIRSACGASAPMDILPAVWLSSVLSVTAGITMAKLLACLSRRRAKQPRRNQGKERMSA